MTDLAISGCPVMHHDFSPQREAGSHWELARELRETCPVFFNSYAQGYWMFTRHEAVREIYKQPRHLLQRVDHPVGAGSRSTAWCRRRSTRPTTSSTGRSSIRGSRRRAIGRGRAAASATSAAAWSSEVVPAGRIDFVGGVRAPLSDRGLPQRDRLPDPPTPICSCRGSRTSSAASAATPTGVEPMVAALKGIREYWVDTLAERRDDPEPRRRRPRFPPHARHLRRSPADRRRACSTS